MTLVTLVMLFGTCVPLLSLILFELAALTQKSLIRRFFANWGKKRGNGVVEFHVFHGVDSCESMRMALFVGDEGHQGMSQWLAI